MKFLKNNFMSILCMTCLFTLVMLGDACADTVFNTAAKKLVTLFKNAKMIIFIIGGFGLIALAFQAIFGKVKWAWFAALAFGLAVVAAAGAIINYASDDTTRGPGTSEGDTGFGDTLNSLGGSGR